MRSWLFSFALFLHGVVLAVAQDLPPGLLDSADLQALIVDPREFTPTAMAIGPDGNVFVTGQLREGPETEEVLIVKIDPSLDTLLYKVFLRGSRADFASAIAIDNEGQAYIAGFTRSLDFPTTAKLGGKDDDQVPGAFLAKISADGTEVLYNATFGQNTQFWSVDVDRSGAAYAAGRALSNSLPNTPGVLIPFPGPDDDRQNGVFGPALLKLDPTGSEVVYVTSYGLGLDRIESVLVQPNGDLVISARETLALLDNGATQVLKAVSTDLSQTTLATDAAQNIYLTGEKRFAIGVRKYSSDASELLFEQSVAQTRLSVFSVTPSGSAVLLSKPTAINFDTLNSRRPCYGTLAPPQGNAGYSQASDPGALTTIGPDGQLLQSSYAPSPLLTASGPQGTYAIQDTPLWIDGHPETLREIVRIDPDAPSEDHVTLACAGDDPAFEPLHLSPGALIQLYGSHLGPETGALFETTGNGIPFDIAGTTVTIDGTPAPVIYAQDDQANVLVPWSTRIDGAVVPICLQRDGEESCILAGTAPFRPRIVIHDPEGQGPGNALAVNQDGTLNSLDTPATPESILTVYITGAGMLSEPVADGALAGPAPLSPLATVEADVAYFFYCGFFAGACPIAVPAEVLEVSTLPGVITAVTQIKIRIPEARAFNFSQVTIKLTDPNNPGLKFSTSGYIHVTR